MGAPDHGGDQAPGLGDGTLRCSGQPLRSGCEVWGVTCVACSLAEFTSALTITWAQAPPERGHVSRGRRGVLGPRPSFWGRPEPAQLPCTKGGLSGWASVPRLPWGMGPMLTVSRGCGHRSAKGRESWAGARPCVNPAATADKPRGVQSRPGLAWGGNEVTDSTGFLVLQPRTGRPGSPRQGSKYPIIDPFSTSVCAGPAEVTALVAGVTALGRAPLPAPALPAVRCPWPAPFPPRALGLLGASLSTARSAGGGRGLELAPGCRVRVLPSSLLLCGLLPLRCLLVSW